MDSTNGEVREKGRAPIRIVMKDRQPFIFAGLWDLWRGDPEAGELYTFTIIITHHANSLLRPYSSQNARDHRQTGRSDLARSGGFSGYFAAGPALRPRNLNTSRSAIRP
jgi:hypothetical protein